ncbi:MAG: hypothetical protein HFJ24_07340 [Clostridia bacterium]|nr:hypothetical protein [Clostridia bacterium]MCI9275732.1 hypothetical protein [Clostridia bacterium]
MKKRILLIFVIIIIVIIIYKIYEKNMYSTLSQVNGTITYISSEMIYLQEKEAVNYMIYINQLKGAKIRNKNEQKASILDFKVGDSICVVYKRVNDLEMQLSQKRGDSWTMVTGTIKSKYPILEGIKLIQKI